MQSTQYNPHNAICTIQSTRYNPYNAHNVIRMIQSVQCIWCNPHNTIHTLQFIQCTWCNPHNIVRIMQSTRYNPHDTHNAIRAMQFQSQSTHLYDGYNSHNSYDVLCIRPGRPVCYFMTPARAEVMPQSNDVLCHPKTSVFKLSRLG